MTEATQTEATTQADTETAAVPTLDSVRKQYFSPAELAIKENLLKVAAVQSMPAELLRLNFDADSLPEGYGILIQPISVRQTVTEIGEDKKPVQVKRTVPIAVGLFAIPDPSTILADQQGAQFARDVLVDACAVKLASMIRPRADGKAGTEAVSLPLSLADFIERQSKADEGLRAYNEMAKLFIPRLKQSGLAINAKELRQVLSSQAYADSKYPKAGGPKPWEQILKAMIAKAGSLNMSTVTLQNWLDTRLEAKVAEVEDLDFSALLGAGDSE